MMNKKMIFGLATCLFATGASLAFADDAEPAEETTTEEVAAVETECCSSCQEETPVVEVETTEVSE